MAIWKIITNYQGLLSLAPLECHLRSKTSTKHPSPKNTTTLLCPVDGGRKKKRKSAKSERIQATNLSFCKK